MDIDLWNAHSGTDLIDGSPETVEDDARRLRKSAGRFNEIGDELGRIRAEGWTGRAADSFEADMRRHPKHWYTAGSALRNVASALDTYAESLRQAIKDADEAVRLVEKAKAHYRTQGWNDMQAPPPSDVIGGDLERTASATLDDARAAVRAAGATAATAVFGYTRSIADYDVDYVDHDFFGPLTQSFSCDGPKFTSWSDLTFVHCEGYQKGGEDFVYHKSPFGIPLDLTGHGEAGPVFDADASIDQDGAHAGVEGMLGAVYTVADTFDVFGEPVTVDGTIHAGPGASAVADIGKDDEGHWGLHVHGSASPIVGVGGGLTVPIPDPVVDTLNDGLDEAGHLGHEAWEHMPWK
jgi:uncharacterized protein YukE